MQHKPESTNSEANHAALDHTQPSRRTPSAEPLVQPAEQTQANPRIGADNTRRLPEVPDLQALQPLRPVRVGRSPSHSPNTASDENGLATTTGIPFGSTVLNAFLQPTQHAQLTISGEQGLTILLLGLIFLVRITNLNYNTLHLDEAIYATVGQQALAGVFDQGATRWMFGSYFYPMTAAVVNQFGGVVALRALSAVLSSLSALFVYLTARRLFNWQAGLWAMFIFGLTGISINVGQHATYDALSIPLLAASFYGVVAAMTEPRRQAPYLILASFAFSLSVLAKYIALLMLPALVLVMAALYLYYRRGLFKLIFGWHWLYFLGPMVALLGFYVVTHFSDLVQVLTSQYANQTAGRLMISATILQDIGIPILLALIGVLILSYKIYRTLYAQHTGQLLLLGTVAPFLLGSLFAMPLYHVLTANIRSMWKHEVFCLVFIAPLAGYAIAQAVLLVRSWHGHWAMAWRFLGAALTVVGILWYVSDALAQNADYHRSWPTNQNVISYMQTQNLSAKSRVLASGYAIYEYYFNLGVHNHRVWDNVWYTEYANLTGEPAVEKAIQDCVYDMVVLDEYYAPTLNPTLEPLLKQAGYIATYQETGYGKLNTRVYTRPPNQACRRTA